ncbi:hypothetical protein THAOC_24956, partial [Thalassiosira oceanica]
MADDLDALFGAIDGGSENEGENNVERSGDEKPVNKRRRLDDDGDGGDGNVDADGGDSGGVTSHDGGETDTADGDGGRGGSSASSAGNKARAVSSMYADVFSSMDHAVGHAQSNKPRPTDAPPSSGDAAAPPTGGAPGDAAAATAAEENREVSTGTSHDKSIRAYSALPDGPPAPGSGASAGDKPDGRPP